MFSKAWLAVAAAGALALVVGCGPSKAPAPSAAPKVSAADKAGAKLFVEYACVHCHGVRGNGGVQPNNGKTPPPPLTGVTAAMVKQYLGKSLPPSQHILSMSSTVSGLAVNDGTLNMPYWYPFLSSKQVDELATYIADGLPKVPGVSDQPLPAKTGKEIYASFACVKCHGPYDSGHNVNPGAIKGHGDHFIPTLGPKGKRFAKALAKWNAPFKTKAANPGYYKYNPTITTASVTGKQFIENKLLLGSIIHDGVIGGAPGAIFMPAWGQLMTPTQLNTIIQYLKTGS